MTSPPKPINVVCPNCGLKYQDWWRPSVNLQLDNFDEEYLDQCRSAVCPCCNFKVYFENLIVDKEGNFLVGMAGDVQMSLSSSVQNEVDRLIGDLDYPRLYRSYEWKNDTYKNGFPDLFRLEQEISQAAKQNTLDKTHLMKIAEWGGLPNKKRISCKRPINIELYTNGLPARWLAKEPEKAISILQEQIKGFGPTYYSKILHFAVPMVFGALDSRLVSVFGKGVPSKQRYSLLNLKVTRSGGRGSISTAKTGWPTEFGAWTVILNYIAQTLNHERIRCPHPDEYKLLKLRPNGIWFPADVETALFSYTWQLPPREGPPEIPFSERTLTGDKSVLLKKYGLGHLDDHR